MKTLKTTIILFLVVLLTSCDPLYSIHFVNNSEKSIYVEFYISNYPDTTILSEIIAHYHPMIESQETTTIYETIGRLPDFFYSYNNDLRIDTVSFYIFDSDTVDYYTWDTIVSKNKVLQRYDLSMSDLEELMPNKYSSILYFPPTEKMMHIHMWPPYGTYNTGNNKDKTLLYKHHQ